MRSLPLRLFSVCALLVAVFALGLPGGQAPPPDDGHCADLNGDRQVNVSDAVYMLAYLFVGGETPVACAQTEDRLGRLEGLIAMLSDEIQIHEGQIAMLREDVRRYRAAVILDNEEPFSEQWCVEEIRECP